MILCSWCNRTKHYIAKAVSSRQT